MRNLFLLWENYPVLVACLEEVKDLFCNERYDEKKKAENAEDILNLIYKIMFTLVSEL